MSDPGVTLPAGDRQRVVEPKFFHAEVAGKSVLVVAKTRRGAANGLARRLASEIEKSLSPASAMEVFKAGASGIEVVDLTAEESASDDDAPDGNEAA